MLIFSKQTKQLNLANNHNLSFAGQLGVVRSAQLVRRVADHQPEHALARRRLGQRDEHALLEAAADGRVQLPRRVRGAEHQHFRVAGPHALHLHQKLGLDAPRGVVLAVRARAAQGVDLVDEDYGGRAFAGLLWNVLGNFIKI